MARVAWLGLDGRERSARAMHDIRDALPGPRTISRRVPSVPNHAHATPRRQEPSMLADSDTVGQISYDYDEFCKDYGHPTGRVFTFEVTQGAVTYVYADVIGLVQGDEVIFSLDASDLVQTRKAH
jgi:hypothetical protein